MTQCVAILWLFTQTLSLVNASYLLIGCQILLYSPETASGLDHSFYCAVKETNKLLCLVFA